jgi:ComF family protein
MPLKLDTILARLGGCLLPPRCVLCGGPGHDPGLDLCVECDAGLPVLPSRCPRCAGEIEPRAIGSTCVRCVTHPPPYTRCHAAFRYADPIDTLVKSLKYGGRLTMSRVLGELLARSIAGIPDADAATLLPVPLHPLRHAERGFNQASEIARWAARRLGIACDDRLATRVLESPRQVGLTAAQRRTNLRGAFVADRARVHGRHVIVLDDVLTTGSTAAALAETLLLQGDAGRVDVWCVALADAPHATADRSHDVAGDEE